MYPIPSPSNDTRAAVKLRRLWGMDFSFLQVGLIAAILAYSFAIPGDLRYKLSVLGFGVCHQIGTHSYFIDEHQLPLCARCSGIYLGAFASLGLLVVLRRRSSRLPAAVVLVVLALFFGAMAADGINSTLQNLDAGLWESTNLLRLLTGSLAGVALTLVFYPMFNLSVWHRAVARRERMLERPIELAAYVLAAGVPVALVLSGGDWLFYPLSLLSIAGMLALLTMANTMLALFATRREALALTFSQALTPLLIGFFLSLVELTLLAWGRASLAPYLANNLGMPLVPGLP